MSKHKCATSKVRLKCPNELTPEDLLQFVEMRPFSEKWQRLRLTDDDLLVVQLGIMARPDRWPAMKGTGGLRKLRFSPESWHSGKRGALRICYAYFPSCSTALLVAVYAKDEKDDLTADEKKTIRAFLRRIKKTFGCETKEQGKTVEYGQDKARRKKEGGKRDH